MSPLTAEQTVDLLKSIGPTGRAYLVGAGGCGISCIGHLLLDMGWHIAGSDLTTNEATAELAKRGSDPSYAIGAAVPQLSRPARWVKTLNGSASQQSFVIEADESDGTLREYLPDSALLVNVDSEHLDHFRNIGGVCAEFSQL